VFICHSFFEFSQTVSRVFLQLGGNKEKKCFYFFEETLREKESHAFFSVIKKYILFIRTILTSTARAARRCSPIQTLLSPSSSLSATPFPLKTQTIILAVLEPSS